ncbi:MAG: hypothetical protein ACOYJX_04645 [Acutalibacteraceae bacterium]
MNNLVCLSFEYLNKPDFSVVAEELFNILADKQFPLQRQVRRFEKMV